MPASLQPAVPANILIVVDPAQDQHLALERTVVSIDMLGGAGVEPRPQLHVLVAVDMDNADTSPRNERIFRNSDWLMEHIVEPLGRSGLKSSVIMSWSSDWYGSILKTMESTDAGIVILPLMQHPSGRERLFNESIWRLLRTSSRPVLITQPGAKSKREKILVAVNFQTHNEDYQRLNPVIIDRGQWMADMYGAELHIVNAYSDSLHHPDRSRLARESGVDRANIHTRVGDPDVVIADVAREIDADIVVLGTRGRSSRWRGNTSERIITRVECDILCIH